MVMTVEHDGIDVRPVPTNRFLMERELDTLCPEASGCEECNNFRIKITAAIAEWDGEQLEVDDEPDIDSHGYPMVQVNPVEPVPLVPADPDLATLREMYEEQGRRWVTLQQERFAERGELERLEKLCHDQAVEGLEFLERVVTRLHQEADNRDWCSEYDAIMSELGFPRRYVEYCVEVNVEIPVTLNVRARGEDEARESVSDSLVWNEIRTNYGYSIPEGLDFEVQEVYDGD